MTETSKHTDVPQKDLPIYSQKKLHLLEIHTFQNYYIK